MVVKNKSKSKSKSPTTRRQFPYITNASVQTEQLNLTSADICQITGQPADSASDSDVWFVKFCDLRGVAFVKMYIATDKGLEYEMRVYRDVIKPLLVHKVSPNFVCYLTEQHQLTTTQLWNVLLKSHVFYTQSSSDSTGNCSCEMTEDMKKYVFVRNMWYAYNKRSQRPAINMLTEVNKKIKFARHDVRYSYMMTEAMPVTALKFFDWASKQRSVRSVMRAVFQVFAAIYAMRASKMSHQDLHLDNVWVRPVGETTVSTTASKTRHRVLTYRYGNDTYRVRTRWLVQVYDFDRAYAKQLGNNLGLTKTLCNASGNCNTLYPAQDYIKVVCGLLEVLPASSKRELCGLIGPADVVASKIDSIHKNCWMIQRRRGPRHNKRVDASFYKGCYDADEILERAAEYAGLSEFSGLRSTSAHTYTCNESMFTAAGVLKMQGDKRSKQACIKSKRNNETKLTTKIKNQKQKQKQKQTKN